ncbi:MAG: LamG-like jellyroll fold domain-containing protein [Sandaracinaceae bacterium]
MPDHLLRQSLLLRLALALVLGSAAAGCGGDADRDGLSDAEEKRLGTSPHLADTDGDGFDDYREVVELSFDPRQDPYRFNPLIADVPRLSFELTSVPTIWAVGSDQRTFGISEATSSARAYTTSRTDSSTHAVEMTHTGSAGISLAGPSLGYSFSHSTTDETSVSFTAETTREMRRELALSQSSTSTLTGGRIAVTGDIRNEGHLAFTLTGLSLSVLQRDGQERTAFRPISALQPEGSTTFPVRTLGPNQAMEQVILGDDDLPVRLAQELLADPRGLVLQVSSYELVDADGIPYSHATTEIGTRTALVLIDYGVEEGADRFLVATNRDRRRGRFPGVTLDEVFATLDLDVELGTSEVLRIGAHAADPARNASWAMNLVRAQDQEAEPGAIGGVVLRAGDVAHFVFVEDADGDGLGRREEFLYRTDPEATDSDGDGFSDYEEVREGWAVAVYGERVFPDPLRGEDYDGDGLDDQAERAAGTDPWSGDTDRDGVSDRIDPDSTDGPGPRPPGAFPGDPVLHLTFDRTLDDASGQGNHGDGFEFWGTDRFGFGERAYDFLNNDFSPGEHPRIEVPSLPLSHALTLAGWFRIDPFESLVRLAGQGQWFELALDDDGHVVFRAEEGFDLLSPEVRDPVAIEDLSAVDPGTGDRAPVWVFLAGVVAYDGFDSHLRLYRNAVLVAEAMAEGVAFVDDRGCSFFVGNNDRSDDCDGINDADALRAFADDIRVYDRALRPDEIDALYHERGYPEQAGGLEP